MPMFGSPMAASRRDPTRAVRLPEGVKLAIIEMVETGADFISAAKQHDVQPQAMRRWLGRAECISFLRKERARFRATVCAQNEAVLADIRDNAENSMARVHAVRTLEQLANEVTKPSNTPSPGITIKIIQQQPQPAPIDVTPTPPRIIDGGE
jgi:hypothetical protein